MNLAVSNIAWEASQDLTVYGRMKALGISGLEIAPTRIFPEAPYEHIREAREWSRRLYEEHGFTVVSMQSIWYGRQEKLFGTPAEREALLEYTKRAVDFARAMDCGNLVFGCPRNRSVPEGAPAETGIAFFRTLGEYAASQGTVLSIEANPPVYHTNYINDTSAALALIRQVGSKGFRLNLDTGTMLENGEKAALLAGQVPLVRHVHISEPGLPPPRERAFYSRLAELLRAESYRGYISLEMGKQEDPALLFSAMELLTKHFA